MVSLKPPVQRHSPRAGKKLPAIHGPDHPVNLPQEGFHNQAAPASWNSLMRGNLIPKASIQFYAVLRDFPDQLKCVPQKKGIYTLRKHTKTKARRGFSRWTP